MSQHIAFLHTSPVHIPTFDNLVKSHDPNLRIEHFVHEDLLLDALRLGIDDTALIARIHRAMNDAASNGAVVVVCTCSTIGGIAERTPSEDAFIAMRIDRAMADRAVELGPRILIVAALESTLLPSQSVVLESATAMQREVQLNHLLLTDAWAHFVAGDRQAYLDAVIAAVRGIDRSTVDVIVLAQASMAAALETLSDFDVPVLASPALGVQSALAKI